MSRFDPHTYSLYRPLYPEKLFAPLIPHLKNPFQGVDLGAGTGFSTLSFLKVMKHAKMLLVEPDLAMLNQAKSKLEGHPAVSRFIQSAAEDLQLLPQSVDLFLMGSSWHWMDASRVIPLLEKALKPGGLVHVFEYQFPKSLHSPDLNEWVRRQFNLHWKAPDQSPRGSLKELTAPLRSSSAFEQVGEVAFDCEAAFTAEDFAGVIFSQSRYLHYERTLSDAQKTVYRDEVVSLIDRWFPKGAESLFFYRMSAFTFRIKR